MKRLLSLHLVIPIFIFGLTPVRGDTPPQAGKPTAKLGNAEHVVLMVWDGLRPDSVTAENTPTLYKLASEGVTFAHNHAVYPTSTEVNGTAIATGVSPGANGIIANKEYRPDINAGKALATESRETIREGDRLTGGKYITVATLAETVQAAGFPTAVAGTKGVILLHDRSENRASEMAQKSAVIVGGKVIPPALSEAIAQGQGAFPALVTFPNTAEDSWTTQALIKQAWKDGVPKFSVLWVSDPDYSQHHSVPGSEEAKAALKSDDDNLAAVLAALDAKGVREKTDVFIVSDHGFSTMTESTDVAAALVSAGFDAVRQLSKAPRPGQILVVSLGGSTLFYVVDHDAAVTARMVDFLQHSKFAGAIFTREKMKGTLTLEALRLNSPAAPDVVMSFHWSGEANQYGVPGIIGSEPGKKDGKGSHASLSRYDVHNTLIGAGPDLKRGMRDELPTGNLDVAPTILAILGIPPEQPLQGRVLTEALLQSTAETPKPVTTVLSASTEPTKGGQAVWSQYLLLTKVGEAAYIDEADGKFGEPEKTSSR